jgi:hypothetical protein
MSYQGPRGPTGSQGFQGCQGQPGLQAPARGPQGLSLHDIGYISTGYSIIYDSVNSINNILDSGFFLWRAAYNTNIDSTSNTPVGWFWYWKNSSIASSSSLTNLTITGPKLIYNGTLQGPTGGGGNTYGSWNIPAASDTMIIYNVDRFSGSSNFIVF